MQIHVYDDDNQTRWARTEGLSELGQQEIAVLAPWPEVDQRSIFVLFLLRFLESYLGAQPKRILHQQTFRYGWVTLRFMRDAQNLSGAGSDVLLIEEPQDPFSSETTSYVPGVARTMTLMLLQHEAMKRNEIIGDATYPHCLQYALVCKRLTPETLPTLRPIMAHRAWKPNTRTSGWFFCCCDRDHDHDHPDELVMVHLTHIVRHFPAIFPYIAMPIDTQIIFQEQRTILFHPGEQEGQIDAVHPLADLSWFY